MFKIAIVLSFVPFVTNPQNLEARCSSYFIDPTNLPVHDLTSLGYIPQRLRPCYIPHLTCWEDSKCSQMFLAAEDGAANHSRKKY